MSADFDTTIQFKGTQAECLAVMKVLCFYANDRKKQYMKDHNCWYLDSFLGAPEEEVKKHWKSGEMELSLSGPYGIMDGPLEDCIDLFQKMADAAPTCIFFGCISGEDAGAEQSLEAEFKDGKLSLESSLREFDFDDEDEDDLDDESEPVVPNISRPYVSPLAQYRLEQNESLRNRETLEGVNVNPGDFVEHPKFGIGTVVQCKGNVLTISFADIGIKKLAKNLAPLKKVNTIKE